MTANGTASEITGKALALLAAGQPGAALEKVGEALAADPECSFAHFTRGNILKRLDRCEEALLAYDRAAMVESAWWHAERTTCLSRLKRHKEALAASDEAIRLAPFDSVVWYRTGAALLRASRQNPFQPDSKLEKRSEVAFKRAIQIDPESYLARIDLAMIYLAKDPKAAERLTNEALSLKFGDPRIHMMAAELALRSGRLEEAASHADIVVSAEPDSPHAVRLFLRIDRARRSRAYALLQRFSALLERSRLAWLLLISPFAVAAIMSGITRAQLYTYAAILGLSMVPWLVYSEWRKKRARRKPILSADY